MATFTYVPSFEATEISRPKTHEFKAGDGYEQAIRLGLNTDPKEWRLVFNERSNAERDDIVGFFESAAGVTSFDWTSPRGIAGKYKCKEWQVSLKSFNFNNIQATFSQVFEP